MNKYISTTFDTVKQEEASYRQSVESALYDYRRTMSKVKEQAKQYKDEDAFINSQKDAAKREAQTAIQLAENAFCVALDVARKSLQDDLHQHLTTRPSAAFLDALRLYHDFNITPSHAEIEALMSLNGGNSLGYRALNQVLKKTNAEYTVDAPDAAAYETDIADLERLSYGNFKYEPDGYHHEMTEVFEGTPQLRLRDDGTTYDAGYRWSGTSLLMASTGYKEGIGAIDAMSDRWSNTLLPGLKHISAYKDTTDPETGETVTAAQQMAQDIKATATAPEIERDGQAEVEVARQRAHDRAEADAQAAAAMKKFML